MGLVAAGASLIGGLVGASGAAQQAQATSAADMYQAQVAANNAQIAKENADVTMKSGDIAATNYGLQSRSKIGTMTATMGANGVDVNTGSNASARAGASQTSMLDALTIRSNAARQAYGYEVQSTSDTAQSQLDQQSAENAQKAGTLAETSSLLGAASSTAKSFSSLNNAGGVGFGVSF